MNGILKNLDQAQRVEHAIRQLIATAPGERLMRPNYGCAIHTIPSPPPNTHTATLFKALIENSLRSFENRLQNPKVSVHFQDPSANILIQGQLKNSPRKLSIQISHNLENP